MNTRETILRELLEEYAQFERDAFDNAEGLERAEEMRMIKHWYDGGYITQTEAISMIKQLKPVKALLI